MASKAAKSSLHALGNLAVSASLATGKANAARGEENHGALKEQAIQAHEKVVQAATNHMAEHGNGGAVLLGGTGHSPHDLIGQSKTKMWAHGASDERIKAALAKGPAPSSAGGGLKKWGSTGGGSDDIPRDDHGRFASK